MENTNALIADARMALAHAEVDLVDGATALKAVVARLIVRLEQHVASTGGPVAAAPKEVILKETTASPASTAVEAAAAAAAAALAAAKSS